MDKKNTLSCIVASTVRSLINQTNELSIPREDILTIVNINNILYLLYFK